MHGMRPTSNLYAGIAIEQLRSALVQADGAVRALQEWLIAQPHTDAYYELDARREVFLAQYKLRDVGRALRLVHRQLVSAMTEGNHD